MNREKFLELLSRHLSGGLSVEEQKLFDGACIASPEYQQLAAEILKPSTPDQVRPESQLKAVWQRINESNVELPVSRLKARWWQLAAAVFLIISAGLFIYRQQQSIPATAFNTLAAADQKIYKTLDDGTTVCLNRYSTLRYNAAFGRAKRMIELQGEAFFDVAHNAAVPLFVHVGEVTIEVKGTAFNVRQQKEQIAIALLRGHIVVSRAGQQVALQPNERLIAKGTEFKVTALDTTIKTAATKWTKDSLVFKKEKLVNLVVLLEKKYQVKIEIKNEKLKNKLFSGVIKQEQLKEALEALKLSYPFFYGVNNKVVTIK
jgi:ferric-dicitrate binding protein FerR (iron transport regulator)